MSSEREAWRALIQWANEAGLRGHRVRNAQVLPPMTATGSYAVFIEEYQPKSATEG